MLTNLDLHAPSQVAKFLANPQIKGLLANWIAGRPHISLLSDAPERGVVYKVESDQGICVLRFPLTKKQAAALKKEARITGNLHRLVRLAIPKTTFFPAENERPAFAVYQWLEGEPLTMYDHMPAAERHKLAHDLADFLVTMHAVDLEQAATWCGEESLAFITAPNYGQPKWFDQSLRANIPGLLKPELKPDLMSVVAETIHRFENLTVSRQTLVLGHGDIHGFNLAMRPTATGYELAGIIDFEIAGILDVHEEFFRLHFIATDLVERTISAYEAKNAAAISLDRARIDLYWRAFLIYLMVEHLERSNHKAFQLYKNLLIETIKD